MLSSSISRNVWVSASIQCRSSNTRHSGWFLQLADQQTLERVEYQALTLGRIEARPGIVAHPRCQGPRPEAAAARAASHRPEPAAFWRSRSRACCSLSRSWISKYRLSRSTNGRYDVALPYDTDPAFQHRASPARRVDGRTPGKFGICRRRLRRPARPPGRGPSWCASRPGSASRFRPDARRTSTGRACRRVHAAGCGC